MACPPQANGTLNASGTGEGKDFKIAESAAQTAMDNDLLARRIAWDKANACPAGCSFIDVWTDLPVVTPPPAAEGQPKAIKKLNFHLGYEVTLKESVGIHRTCYATQAAETAGKQAREAAEKEAADEAAKAAKKAAEGHGEK